MLIVEDHAPMRQAIRVCIERSFPGLSVTEAPDGATALKYVEAHCPSLVVMDINLPDSSGLDLTRDILKQWPCTFIAAISIDTSADLAARVRSAGASEFIGKDELFERLLPLVGAAVTLTNWMKGLEFHYAITDESSLYKRHHAENSVEIDDLRVGHD